eukprot:SAG31_NODE_610_length_13564_cov_3.189528_14_plen_93_part_00
MHLCQRRVATAQVHVKHGVRTIKQSVAMQSQQRPTLDCNCMLARPRGIFAPVNRSSAMALRMKDVVNDGDVDVPKVVWEQSGVETCEPHSVY